MLQIFSGYLFDMLRCSSFDGTQDERLFYFSSPAEVNPLMLSLLKHGLLFSKKGVRPSMKLRANGFLLFIYRDVCIRPSLLPFLSLITIL